MRKTLSALPSGNVFFVLLEWRIFVFMTVDLLIPNFCFLDTKIFHIYFLLFFVNVARQIMYTLFSFTAVVAFGDRNIFAKISWQTFDRYFECKVVSMFVCNNNGCLLQRTQFV